MPRNNTHKSRRARARNKRARGNKYRRDVYVLGCTWRFQLETTNCLFTCREFGGEKGVGSIPSHDKRRRFSIDPNIERRNLVNPASFSFETLIPFVNKTFRPLGMWRMRRLGRNERAGFATARHRNAYIAGPIFVTSLNARELAHVGPPSYMATGSGLMRSRFLASIIS